MAALPRLREWLANKKVSHVVMESTGSYWIPVFNILEDHFVIVLANPEEVKNRKGHKTDRKDAEHLADLLRHDHVRSSYIPPKPVRDLRDLTRRRLQLTEDATRERNRVQKLLEHVNVKIGNVLSDIFGVSGLDMLLALLSGQATPEEIAQLARGQAKRKIPQVIEALEGHRMSEHERLLIRSCLRHLACLEEEVEELDGEILRRMQMPPFEAAYGLMQTLPGVGQLAAASILAETGTDMRHFPRPIRWRAGRDSVREIERARASKKEARRHTGTPICAPRWCSAPGRRLESRGPYSRPAFSNYRRGAGRNGPLWP